MLGFFRSFRLVLVACLLVGIVVGYNTTCLVWLSFADGSFGGRFWTATLGLALAADIRLAYEFWMIGVAADAILHINGIRERLAEIRRSEHLVLSSYLAYNGFKSLLVWLDRALEILIAYVDRVSSGQPSHQVLHVNGSRWKIALLGLSPIPGSRQAGIVACRLIDPARGFLALAVANAVRIVIVACAGNLGKGWFTAAWDVLARRVP